MPSPTSVSVLSVQTLSTTSFPSQALSPWSLMSPSLSLDLLFILTTISIFCFPHNSVSISSTSLLVQTLCSSFWVSIKQLLTGLPTFLFASCESFLHLGYNDLAETRWGNGAFFHSTPISLDRHASLISWPSAKSSTFLSWHSTGHLSFHPIYSNSFFFMSQWSQAPHTQKPDRMPPTPRIFLWWRQVHFTLL